MKGKPSTSLFDNYNTKYFALIQKYADRIALEVYGHDHFADLRYHKDDAGVFNHNMMLSPGLSPNTR